MQSLWPRALAPGEGTRPRRSSSAQMVARGRVRCVARVTRLQVTMRARTHCSTPGITRRVGAAPAVPRDAAWRSRGPHGARSSSAHGVPAMPSDRRNRVSPAGHDSGTGPRSDERDPDIGVHHTCATPREPADDYLQRREHPSLEEVTSARCPVRQPEHDVYVHAGTGSALGDVTDQRRTSHGSSTGMRRYCLVAVEPADDGAGEGATAVICEASRSWAPRTASARQAPHRPGRTPDVG